MRTHTFVATAVLAAFVAAAPLASAQDRQRWPSRGNSGGGGGASQRDSGGGQRDSGGSSGRQRDSGTGQRDSGSGQHDSGSGQRTAAPREGGRVQQPAPRDSGQTEQRAANGRREVAPRQPAQQQDERQPQVSTPRGSTGNGGGGSDGRYDNNGRYAGARYAVPRSGPAPYYRDGDHRVYAQPRQNYYVYRYPSYRYAYPYRYYGSPYPYYGYSYYDPGFTGSFYWSNHAWQPQAYYYGANNDYDLGKLRLDMEPREAEVYIDGYYAGIVDEFDGQLQGLRLQAGTYRVQVALPGFQPLDFDVRISSGRTTTYRGELNAEP